MQKAIHALCEEDQNDGFEKLVTSEIRNLSLNVMFEISEQDQLTQNSTPTFRNSGSNWSNQ